MTWIRATKNTFINLNHAMLVEGPEDTGRVLHGELFIRLADGSEHKMNGEEAADLWQLMHVLAHVRKDQRS
jgi:hypothetical protein